MKTGITFGQNRIPYKPGPFSSFAARVICRACGQGVGMPWLDSSGRNKRDGQGFPTFHSSRITEGARRGDEETAKSRHGHFSAILANIRRVSQELKAAAG